MSFRLVDTGWDQEFTQAVAADHSCLRIVCPFIKSGAVGRLLGSGRPDSLQVITRFCLDDFVQGVNDLSALRLLLENGAAIRGVKHLHSKLYLFGSSRAIITSANLTEAALLRNHEFGVVAEDQQIVAACKSYFDDLWAKAGTDLTEERLDQWEQKVTSHQASGACPGQSSGLGDEGVNVGIPPVPIELPSAVADAKQAFVKFFGESEKRFPRSLPVLDDLRDSGSHWACTYPKGKRPRSVKDGAIMLIARLVKDPDDILIYGRAIGLRYIEGRDDATAADISRRAWKATWPHYVRVHDPQFVAGTLANGVSLKDMMESLGSSSFLSTQRNALSGTGNTDPRLAYRRQAAVELTREGFAWLNDRLQMAFNKYGTLPEADLKTLDWPSVVNAKAGAS